VITVAIEDKAGTQSVTLPSEFRFDVATVTIRKVGDAVILEPVKASSWPDGFFQDIRIDDPAFCRPDQGTMPPVHPLDMDSAV
jgi:virulence-associated protein VagC